MEKFKSNPYNINNKLITSNDINYLFKNIGLMNNDIFHQTFKITDIKLYQMAFIHTSYTKLKDYSEYENIHNYLDLQDYSYEKIEFLGDALLGSVVSSYLYDRYATIHNQNEGFLTKTKIKIICGEQLAYLSKCIGFDKYAIISEHIDNNCDGRNNKNILEDIFEAFIGALYLDTRNHDIIKTYIIHIIEKYIDFSDMILNDSNYKEQLLKYFQHNYRCTPTYNTSKKDENNFECIITYSLPDNNDIVTLCKFISKTKKKAEQLAAKEALIKLHVIS